MLICIILRWRKDEGSLCQAVFLPENRIIKVVKERAVLVDCLYKPALPAHPQLFHDTPGACIGFQGAGADTVDVQGAKGVVAKLLCGAGGDSLSPVLLSKPVPQLHRLLPAPREIEVDDACRAAFDLFCGHFCNLFVLQ